MESASGCKWGREEKDTRCGKSEGVGCFFFFNDTATTEIYTLSLHDALPICHGLVQHPWHAAHHVRQVGLVEGLPQLRVRVLAEDRKSTRLNSSHTVISYAVFCLKKKKKNSNILTTTLFTHLLYPINFLSSPYPSYCSPFFLFFS